MADERRINILVKCINQLVRPKIKVPKFIRPKGCGDCTTCESCPKNLNCSCYIPIGLTSYDTSDK